MALALRRCMTRYGFHASHEQHAPDRLLAHVRAAESAGFEAAMCSDHFHPWLPEQGESGFAWAWLGAALEATSLSFGTVCAPGWRYHPAVIAQGAATLGMMYPGRFWLAIGSGEALNEAITGMPWPAKAERTAQLGEIAGVMKQLWRGETVTHHGRVVVEEAKLYSRPKTPPRLFAAALSAETAAAVAPWADALMTIGGEPARVREVIDAFRTHGGEGKPVALQHVVSWAPTEREARDQAYQQWRQSALDPAQLAELRTPAQFAEAVKSIDPADVAKSVHISADPGRHAEWLAAYEPLGVDTVYVMNAGKNQEQYIEAFGAKVLPQLR
jgi:coenzyme F420-dependent glucose-6-phosphate dehydrogenase